MEPVIQVDNYDSEHPVRIVGSKNRTLGWVSLNDAALMMAAALGIGMPVKAGKVTYVWYHDDPSLEGLREGK